MKLSTRSRYGTRALLELTLHESEAPVSLREIARRQQISLPYLEQIIAPLIAGQIIRSVKGPKGGVSLARAPRDIRLSEVIQLLEGSTAPVECINNPEVCERSDFCVTRDIWSEMKKAMDKILEATTLQDLADRQREKGQKEPAMFFI